MLVGTRMSTPVITIEMDTPIQEALIQMKKEKVRRFPVVDKNGKLVGIVSESDLLNASPSDATSLSVWEVNYLLSKITVERIMSRDVITVTEDTPLEEAARIMADHKIGGLPVMRDKQVVGIITETNLFKIFLELLGARTSGVRMTVLVEDKPGTLLDLTNTIYKAGGNIIAVSTFLGETANTRTLTFKINNITKEVLQKEIEPLIIKIIDLRDMKIS
jgi:acetoin utilization protein AcuB